jgi:hypothetical protein
MGIFDSSPPLEFRYVHRAGYPTPDQTLFIDLRGRKAYAVTLRLIPWGTANVPLPAVKVVTAHGSDRAELVALPGLTIDHLMFEGEDAPKVRGVDVELVLAEPVKGFVSRLQPLSAVAMASDGSVVSPEEPFTKVLLRNPNRDGVWSRAAYTVREQHGGDSNPLAIVQLCPQKPVWVPPLGEVDLDPPDDLREAFHLMKDYWVSITAYPSI